MKHFDLLETRHHVKEYSDKIPKKELIENSLWKAWKTTPSKNNAMPYKVFVYGPEHKEEKIKVWEMVFSNHKDAEIRAMKRGQATRTEGGVPNPYYEHIKYNPYLFCIHAQPREPNDWYKESVKRGMFFDQAWPERIESFIDTSAVEVGMFIQNLSTYLLEEKIDISYTSCFRREQKYWQEVGLKHAEYRPIILMTSGYHKKYRKDVLYVKQRIKKDIKPEYEEMIQWM